MKKIFNIINFQVWILKKKFEDIAFSPPILGHHTFFIIP